jgi:hypothetical protein
VVSEAVADAVGGGGGGGGGGTSTLVVEGFRAAGVCTLGAGGASAGA